LVSDKESQNDLKPNYILYPVRDNDTINEEGVLNSRSSRLFAEKFFIPFTENESINLAFKSGEPKNSLIVVPIEGELIDADSHKTICERNNITVEAENH